MHRVLNKTPEGNDSRWWKRAMMSAILLTGTMVGLLAIHQLLFPLIACAIPSTERYFYNIAVFGIYRTAQYITIDSRAPLGTVKKWDDACDDGLVLVAPFGPSVGKGGPRILDARGELVWAADTEHDTATNFNVQLYDGKRYLTYWSGDKHGGEGSGKAYMLDSHYNVWKSFQAIGEGLRTDLHEFAITDDGHAIISTINETTADLRGRGHPHSDQGWIEDSVFQEIDIESGELVFQWRSRDHFGPEESYYWKPMSGYMPGWAYDFFHLNSVQKDSEGNYLVSARHLHKLIYIDGQTGKVIWSLGGHEGSNDFVDLSDGAATSFKWQHHARWVSQDEGLITLMDNGRAGSFQRDASFSEALTIKVDPNNRTAELVHSYTSMDKAVAPSQGSVQVQSNGNVFVGWGSVAAWSEHKPDGELLCEYHYAASAFFWTQRVKNYRTFKVYGWKGEPDYPPTAKTRDGKVYVSWNGATEVRFWKLQRARVEASAGEEKYQDIEVIKRSGFESFFVAPKDGDASFRVVALDNDRQFLGASEIATEAEGDGVAGAVSLSVLAVLGCAAGSWLAFRLWARRRKNGDHDGWELRPWGSYKYERL